MCVIVTLKLLHTYMFLPIPTATSLLHELRRRVATENTSN